MFNRKKRLKPTDPEFAENFRALMNDPVYQGKLAKRSEDFNRMLNTPMRWYHKLPYWIIFGLIIYGVGKLIGVV